MNPNEIPTPEQLSPEEVEVLCDERFVRELAVQLVAMLPFWTRLLYLALRPQLWLRFLLRNRQAPVLASNEDVECVPEPNPDHFVSAEFRRCLLLEQQLIDCGQQQCLLEKRGQLAAIAESARWKEFDTQISAHLGWLKLILNPADLLRHLLRIKKQKKPHRIGDLPQSTTLKLRSGSRN